jgi:acetylornithine/succinyldiaminopimelate/putrescine aminotransferase
MGAVLATEAVAQTVAQGEQGTTFGGGPMACAAGMAVLDVLEQEHLTDHAAKMEQAARDLLITGPVKKIRGHGLLLGLETAVPAKGIAAYLMGKKMLVGTSSDPNVLRLMPPLVMPKADLEALAKALKAYA